MAQIDSECSVLLADGTCCRRAARYTCAQWHLICASHQPQSFGIQPAACPLCGLDVVAFSHIEGDMPGGRRSGDTFVGSMNSFFLRARNAITLELHDEPGPIAADEDDLEDEI